MAKLSFNPIELATNIREKVIEGELDGLDIYLYLKRLETLIEILKSDEDIKNSAWDEVSKYGKGEKCLLEGATFKKQTRAVYSYDFEEYSKTIKEMQEKVNSYKEKLKNYETIAKSLLNQGVESSFFPDPDTGEEKEVKAATKVKDIYIVSVSLPENEKI